VRNDQNNETPREATHCFILLDSDPARLARHATGFRDFLFLGLSGFRKRQAKNRNSKQKGAAQRGFAKL
jgi:hypothetical protein